VGAFERALSFGRAVPGDATPLVAAVRRASEELGGSPRRLFHLAVPPAAFEPAVTMLGGTGLAHGARIIVEKPFGTDLASARLDQRHRWLRPAARSGGQRSCDAAAAQRWLAARVITREPARASPVWSAQTAQRCPPSSCRWRQVSTCGRSGRSGIRVSYGRRASAGGGFPVHADWSSVGAADRHQREVGKGRSTCLCR
jgi:hypothetical protein